MCVGGGCTDFKQQKEIIYKYLSLPSVHLFIHGTFIGAPHMHAETGKHLDVYQQVNKLS